MRLTAASDTLWITFENVRTKRKFASFDKKFRGVMDRTGLVDQVQSGGQSSPAKALAVLSIVEDVTE
jgi:hypothetical protein